MVENKILLTSVYGRRVIIHLVNDAIERIRVVGDETGYPIGTVVIARVKKMLPSTNACFIDIGNGTDYFFSIPTIPGSIIYADNKKHSCLKCEDQILVQISSEKIKTKAPTVTNSISLHGDLCVVENGTGLSFSKKISVKDRKNIVLPSNINDIISKSHVIIRTQGASLENTKDLEAEINELSEKYQKIISRTETSSLYTVLHKPAGIISDTIMEWKKDGVSELITDIPEYSDLCKNMAANSSVSYRFYDDEYGLHKLYKLETLIDEIKGKKVYLKSGAYLIVEQGETLTAIDVNSAHAIKGDKEDAVFKINIEAAHMIGHILKNRSLSGMILVDFINMKDPHHEKELIETMKSILSNDDVLSKYIDMTGLGLMEITRQRVYQTFIEQWKG